ncbi:MAG TPA: response regulator [Kiritimatiellia bacterium]|nr:response regulator [Kiritimatiellia bacterium]HPJ57732.1 response regulator [Kiritimatiellia bacterium]
MPIQVLLIDDEASLCQVLKRGLEAVGDYQVEVALSGSDGLRKARRHGPDVILLDINMPRMNGFEVLRALKSGYPASHIPVIMLSCLTDENTKTECNYEYGEEYIEKPVELSVLNERILAVLRRCGRLPPAAAPDAPPTAGRPPDPGAAAP